MDKSQVIEESNRLMAKMRAASDEVNDYISSHSIDEDGYWPALRELQKKVSIAHGHWQTYTHEHFKD